MYSARWSILALFVAGPASAVFAAQPASPSAHTVRVAAAQPRARLIDWRIKDTGSVLANVDRCLGELEGIFERAAAQHCDVVAFPEDTLGLGHWQAGNEALSRVVLPEAVERMLARFGTAAAKHQMYVVCCNNNAEPNGAIYNTAFLLGRDGQEIGRYRKVCPTIHERFCTPGDKLPVFNTRDLGGVGMLICYDMVFPETARALALGGADVIFHPTLGGAAIGDRDISRAAFRTRAVENFVYLVVSQRGAGSMIVSPQGKIIAEAQGADSLAIADIDPFGGREGGDAMNHQRDMRARLFRERNPAAFGILTDPQPPVLSKVPATITEREAVLLAQKVLTVGEEEFRAAAALANQGKTSEAIAAFTRLRREYRDSWIDRVAAERLANLPNKQVAPTRIGLQPQPGAMQVTARVSGLDNQAFALGIPETIGCREAMLVNFPEAKIEWQGPDAEGVVSCSWGPGGRICYSLRLIPAADYVDVEMTIRNQTEFTWHGVFAFNCVNPIQAPAFRDWKLARTYMSSHGKPLCMAQTTRVKGHMPTVGFYLPESVTAGDESVFVSGFGATSPDRTDGSWIVTFSEPAGSYMAATAVEAAFLFDNLDRCCLHAAPSFGDIGPREESTTISRIYLAKGTLEEFLQRCGADRPQLMARQKWARNAQ